MSNKSKAELYSGTMSVILKNNLHNISTKYEITYNDTTKDTVINEQNVILENIGHDYIFKCSNVENKKSVSFNLKNYDEVTVDISKITPTKKKNTLKNSILLDLLKNNLGDNVGKSRTKQLEEKYNVHIKRVNVNGFFQYIWGRTEKCDELDWDDTDVLLSLDDVEESIMNTFDDLGIKYKED